MGLRITQQEFISIMDMFLAVSETSELEAKLNRKVEYVEFQRGLAYFAKVMPHKHVNTETLDISASDNSRVRISLLKMGDIVEYCKTNNIPVFNDSSRALYITKTKQVQVDLHDYPLRIKLASEVPMEPIEAKNAIGQNRKQYRLKKRISMSDPKSPFRFDFTTVRSSNKHTTQDTIIDIYYNLKLSYEIEIEYDRVKATELGLDNETCAKQLLGHLSTLLKVIEDVEYLLPIQSQINIQKQYISLAYNIPVERIEQSVIQKSPKQYFVGPQPVTLEKHNLTEPTSENAITVLNGDYTITEKADGERQLVFVDDHGNCYLINSRLRIMDTGFKTNDASFKNSIFDAEVVKIPHKQCKAVLMFDTYMRNSQLTTTLPLMVRASTSTNSSNSRLEIAKAFKKTLASKYTKNVYEFSVKEFVFPTKDTFFQAVETMLLTINGINPGYHRDGIIFTPASLVVGASNKNEESRLGGTWNTVLKWKPPNDNSIDFLVQIERDVRGNEIMQTRLVNGAPTNFKTLKLYVGSRAKYVSPMDYVMQAFKNDKAANNNNNRSNDYYKKLFDVSDKDGKKSYTCEIALDASGRMMCNGGLEEIQDDSVVEMFYDNSKSRSGWVPLRVRQDKTELYRSTQSISNTANDYNTALSIWNTIQDPITEDHIKGKIQLNADELDEAVQKTYYIRNTKDRNVSSTYAMKCFHNYWIKSKLLIGNVFANKPGRKSLLDFACGEGGDLDKWIKNNYTDVLGLDISSHNITNPQSGAYTRLMGHNGFRYDQHRYLFLPMDVSETIDESYINRITDDNIKTIAQVAFGYRAPPNKEHPFNKFYKFTSQGFDVTSCQFAIHYMFKDDKSLTNFAKNVAQYTRDNGYFIGTCFDGDILHNKLKDLEMNQTVEGKKDGKVVWFIRKKYDSSSPQFTTQQTGNQVGVFFETINVHNKDYDEYLVSYERLVKELGKQGLRPLEQNEYRALGLTSSTGLFDQAFREMVQYYGTHSYQPGERDILENAIRMNGSDTEKEFSFMNRWFIFKKASEAIKVDITKILNEASEQEAANATTTPSQETKDEIPQSPQPSEPPQPKPKTKKTTTTKKKEVVLSNTGDEPEAPAAVKKPRAKKAPAIVDPSTSTEEGQEEKPKKPRAKKASAAVDPSTSTEEGQEEKPKKPRAKKAPVATETEQEAEPVKKTRTKKSASPKEDKASNAK